MLRVPARIVDLSRLASGQSGRLPAMTVGGPVSFSERLPACLRSLKVGKKLYVGNLTYRTNSSDLEQLFSQYGTVQSAEVISDRETGRSKGFGFVEMTTEAEAKAAIEALHEHEIDGRRLTVNEARPREPRPGGGGGWRGGSGGGGGRDGGYDSRH